jgi:hypothetical protein
VKDVKLKDSGNREVDWERWERKAVDASIKQIRGAIRWLDCAEHVVAKDGTQGLPLPALARREYHRIAVAFGGHRKVPTMPITSSKGGGNEFFHILDEQSFYLLVRHLDTISDFVQYLADKERFLSRASVIVSGGEENLLAVYLHDARQFPKEGDFLMLTDGLWDSVSSKSEFLAKIEKDQDSYIWDRLIESFCAGEYLRDSSRIPNSKEMEQALRVLARENRFARRLLGRSFREFLQLSKAGKVRSRCAKSLSNVGYVFFAYDSDSTLEQRRAELVARCFASLCHFPECARVIGIDINIPGESPHGGYSMDLVMLHTDRKAWPEDYLDKGRSFRDNLGYFKGPSKTSVSEDEYPIDGKGQASQQADG